MIAPQMKALVDLCHDADLRLAAQGAMLDRTFDLHNDLTDWATNTEHDEAAMEVMAILDQYTTVPVEPNITLTDSQVLSPETAA